jgi:hypothetical protein
LQYNIHLQDVLHLNETRDAHAPCLAEESICSFKSNSPIGHAFEGIDLGVSSVGKVSTSISEASGSKFSNPVLKSQHESQNVSIIVNLIFSWLPNCNPLPVVFYELSFALIFIFGKYVWDMFVRNNG